MSAPALIANAMAGAINSNTFSKAAQAFRSYDASTELPDLESARLDIIAPTAWTKETVSRIQIRNTCAVTVFIRKKLPEFDDEKKRLAEIDAWVDFVDQFSDAAWFTALSSLNATLVENGVTIDTPFDRDALAQQDVFLAIVTLTLQWWTRPTET